MTIKKLLIIILAAILLPSCNLSSNDEYELTVNFNNAGGLTSNSDVILNGVVIGYVKSIVLERDNKVITTISINKEQQLPSDSKAYLIHSVLGDATIEIEPGVGLEMFKNGQQIEGQEKRAEFSQDINIENVMSLVGELLNPDRKATQDSILWELRILNKNIEKLIEKE